MGSQACGASQLPRPALRLESAPVPLQHDDLGEPGLELHLECNQGAWSPADSSLLAVNLRACTKFLGDDNEEQEANSTHLVPAPMGLYLCPDAFGAGKTQKGPDIQSPQVLKPKLSPLAMQKGT